MQAAYPHIIILAAGHGRRFGTEHHKSLSPLLFGLGTLPLLLRRLQRLVPATHLHVATGHQADRVVAVVQEHVPGAACVQVAGGGDGSVLQSLAAVLATLTAGRGAWVLFADSHYHPDILEQLAGTGGDAAVIAATPWRADADHPVGIRTVPGDDRRVAALTNSATPSTPLMMVPAVYWPRTLWPAVCRAADAGLGSQWHMLRTVLTDPSAPPVTVWPLAADAIGDIDTPADLRAWRRHWLEPEPLAYFRDNVSKDERSRSQPDRLQDGRFIKNCHNEDAATHEDAVLRWLANVPGEPLVPQPYGITGRQLIQQQVTGIRLYDLLRLLARIGRTQRLVGIPQANLAERAAITLLGRSLDRVGRIQRALLSWPVAATLPPYPLDTHIRQLLAMLLRLLQLPPLSAEQDRDLARFQDQWARYDAIVPFRDATPKNILVAEPSLAPGRDRCDLMREAAVTTWLRQPGVADTVPLIDYDFTSTCHLTAPEDDIISLLGHVGSRDVAVRLLAARQPARTAPPSWIDWLRDGPVSPLPDICPDRSRAARALLVRYLRFGGRKLIYRIINPTGYATRFRFDDPAPYFTDLPGLLLALDPGFDRQWPALIRLLRQLADAVTTLPPWSAQEMEQDAYLAAVRHPVTYWQESPLEGSAVPA